MLTGDVPACCAHDTLGTNKEPNRATQTKKRLYFCDFMPKAYRGSRFESAQLSLFVFLSDLRRRCVRPLRSFVVSIRQFSLFVPASQLECDIQARVAQFIGMSAIG